MRRGFFALVAAAMGIIVALPLGAQPPAERLVVIGGGLTEIVFALGAGDQVVATDTTSIYPPAAEALPKLGYQRTLAVEGVLALAPTRIIAGPEAGPPRVIDQLRGAGIPVQQLAEDYDLGTVSRRIRVLGAALKRDAAAEALAQSVEADLAALQAAIAAQGGRRPRVLFLLSVGQGAPMAAGRDTAAHAIITAAGGDNPLGAPGAAGYRGYKPLSVENAALADPEILLITRQSLDLVGGIDALLAQPGLNMTQAARTRRVLALDALYLLGFGPRLPRAVADLAAQFRMVGVQ